jgi:hypothetical protein
MKQNGCPFSFYVYEAKWLSFFIFFHFFQLSFFKLFSELCLIPCFPLGSTLFANSATIRPFCNHCESR